MTRHRLEFPMAASASVVFDAFHYHAWRQRWDTLVRATHVLGGAPCPFVGAITENAGAGWLSGLAMRTQFISYARPHLAAAQMVGRSFPFVRWAASMRHRDLGSDSSLMVYAWSLDTVAPRALIRPIAEGIFRRQTQRRFARLQAFVREHRREIEAWQAERAR